MIWKYVDAMGFDFENAEINILEKEKNNRTVLHTALDAKEEELRLRDGSGEFSLSFEIWGKEQGGIFSNQKSCEKKENARNLLEEGAISHMLFASS
jgi:hypothetical protein